MKNRVVFAGFEHSHMFSIYRDISESDFFEAAGACEPNEKARAAAEEKGVVFTHSDFDSMINRADVDTVAVGAHFAARGAIVIKALEAGKNVISDKPLCTSMQELETIKKLSEEKNLTVCIFLSLRQNPNILGAVTAIRNGAVGKVNNIIFEGEHPLFYGSRADWYFEDGKHGGVINDLAVHGIDIVRLMTGSDVKKVIAAREWNFFAKEKLNFNDSAQFMIELESGAGAIADVSYCAPDAYGYAHPSYWHFRVFGSEGMVDFGETVSDVTLYPKEGEITKIPPIKPEMSMLDEFLAAVSGRIDRREYTRNMLEATRQTLMIENSAEIIK